MRDGRANRDRRDVAFCRSVIAAAQPAGVDATRRNLLLERGKLLATVTTTDAEYKAKWEAVNALTVKLAETYGPITAKMKEY